jgi:23S rRNA pseudouridine2605 synthase
MTARQCVNLFEAPGHLYPVGWLDFESEGLILMTNDGELTNHLTHPKFGHSKEYKVLLARRPDQDQIEAWKRGVVLDGCLPPSTWVTCRYPLLTK